MRQRRYPQDQLTEIGGTRGVVPPDQHSASVSALHAVQVALDRRDNGGDAHAADTE